MVYCGKASKGCENCRIRRIKCDKLSPDCSQCVRVGKKCPGYRDQLSLMFRDESNKVIQKAHAQWGVGDDVSPPSSAVSSHQSPPPFRVSTSPQSPRDAEEVFVSSTVKGPVSSAPTGLVLVSNRKVDPTSRRNPRLYSPIQASIDEQAKHFCFKRYIIGQPDEPQSPSDLRSSPWVLEPALEDIVIAVGLAGLSHTRSDPQIMANARQRYTGALRQTGQLIQSRNKLSLNATTRLVVMLALFELVKGPFHQSGGIQAHVLGGTALIKSCPLDADANPEGLRSFIQLCYAMFLSWHEGNLKVDNSFLDCLAFGNAVLEPSDRPAVELGYLICRFLEYSADFHAHTNPTGEASSQSIFREMLDLDEQFAQWENMRTGRWQYRKVKTTSLPPEVIFQGERHVYDDMWFARMWAHYRWARLLLNQLLLDFDDRYGTSAQPLLSTSERKGRQQFVMGLARDTLVSTPSHWRHPLLPSEVPVSVDRQADVGCGAGGVPVLVFQLRAAACIPNIPREYWEWAHNTIQCIWSEMGMYHAKSIVESMSQQKEPASVERV